MKKISVKSWVGAALVASASLVGMNAAAVKAVSASLVTSGTCSNPAGFQYTARAAGTDNSGNELSPCITELGLVGSAADDTSLSECGATAPTKLKARVGKVSTTTYAFTDSGVTAGFVAWSNGATATSANWVQGSCTLAAFAGAHN